MAIPSIPQNFYCQQGNGQVFLSWSLVPGATSYTVQRSTDGITYTNLATANTNNYLDATVSVGTQYYYQVSAHNTSGDSSYTTPQSIVPTLAGELCLGQVRLLAQQRADRVNSNFITLPEWNSYINQSYFELYDLLVTLYEDYYVASPLTLTTNGSSNLYPLPDGTNYPTNGVAAKPFYKLLGVECSIGNSGGWVSLKKFDFISRNQYVFPNVTSTYMGVFNLQYRIVGSNLMLIPTPAGGQSIRIWYVPRATQLLQDTDILDGISGWTEYVIVDAAIKALQKEESDVSVLLAQKAALRQRIEESAMNRDAGQPDTISDVRAIDSGWNGHGGSGWDGGF